MTDETETAEKFSNGALYKKLVEVLPVYVKDPFSETPTLNVKALREALGKSHEGVYKWLRSSSIRPKVADELIDLANREDNVSILTHLKRTPPTRRDFDVFVYGA